MLSLTVTFLCFALGLVRLFYGTKSFPGWCFSAGMFAFGAEGLLQVFAFRAETPSLVAAWESYALFAAIVQPPLWLCFSLSFSRGNWREFLTKWRWLIAAAVLLPLVLAAIAPRPFLPLSPVSDLLGEEYHLRTSWAVKGLHIVSLFTATLILMNLEQTFRAAIGASRWRIKFVVLGLAVIFGTRIYTHTQVILFSAETAGLANIRLAGMLIGALLIAMAYLRTGFAELDVYPSQAVLRTSITIFLVGAYLLIVGVLAQAISYLGGSSNFPAQAFLVLVALVFLAVLLLSDRLRQQLGLFVARHFKKARHDTLRLWTRASRELGSLKDRAAYGAAICRLFSESFEALSVSVWNLENGGRQLTLAGSTAQGTRRAEAAAEISGEILAALRSAQRPFDLQTVPAAWADQLRAILSPEVSGSATLLCVPLCAGEELLAVALLADRVNGIPYSLEELDLLKCLSEQCGAGLLNLRLTLELIQSHELEAFRAISAFFVHDLKNAASTLSLMLRNLPTHFEDPEFRRDALRGISSATDRINQLIERLSAFRGTLQLRTMPFDLNAMVRETVGNLQQLRDVAVIQELCPRARVTGDEVHIQSVLTNLLLNAREALSADGEIRVVTSQQNGHVFLSVSDNGCGMSEAFVQNDLFRPFRTTKKRGLGIGIFHSRMIVTAHRGTMVVKSAPGKGSTFHISLPADAA